jgi:hypothetical protein
LIAKRRRVGPVTLLSYADKAGRSGAARPQSWARLRAAHANFRLRQP